MPPKHEFHDSFMPGGKLDAGACAAVLSGQDLAQIEKALNAVIALEDNVLLEVSFNGVGRDSLWPCSTG